MTVLIYGAYGFTGRLIAAEAVDRGLDPIVAGRDAARIARLGRELGCEWRAFDLSEPPTEPLADVETVLHCAGPFVHTAPPMVQACLETATNYLDITGELSVFEAIAERDRAAEDAGICLLPGVGFDVVPTDCLAARLKRRLPDAETLRIGIEYSGPLSSGTLKTLIEHLDAGGRIRQDGTIREVPPGWQQRTIDFGGGPQRAVSVPLADVSTAYYTTGIQTIEAYVGVPRGAGPMLRLAGRGAPLFRVDAIRRMLQTIVDVVTTGPTAEQRATNTARIWAEVERDDEAVSERLRTPEPYALTIDSATTALQRLQDSQPTGFETPAAAFGDRFALSLDGVELQP